MVLAHHTFFVFVTKRQIKCEMKFCKLLYSSEAAKCIAYKIIELFYLYAKIGLYTTHAIFMYHCLTKP